LKWLIVVDVQQQILLAQRARQGPGCDARSLPGLLDVAARGAPIGVVLADAEFDSEANHAHIRQRLGAKSIIPARRRGIPNGAIRNQMFRAFPKKPYRQRSKIESVFSAVKRKLSSRAPGRSLTTQIRQALLLGLAYNRSGPRPLMFLRDIWTVALWRTDTIQTHSRIVAPRLFVIPKLDALEGTFAEEVDDVVLSSG
jgi:hypothetical protein